MKQMIINIPDMQSAHCQVRVNNAVKDIEGVQIQNVEAGKITVTVASDTTKSEIVNAIEKAGYSVSPENSNSESDCATGCCNN
ncbi:copper chaperone [Flavobacterium sp. 28YEA47A]|uniref:heavy-metal-associated domain-containing protein n=1 Tax=Flavobacterium sp. 28YEA47A TaxID=3156276 RepID=UPI003514128E